jgi:ribosomal protein S18 acetylase RimI-like enzyme
MNAPVIKTDTSYATDIETHFLECDARFSPPLSSRVNLSEYAKKLAELADRFEAWDSDRLIGLVAAYIRNSNQIEGFITSVSVCGNFEGQGIGSLLMQHCLASASAHGLTKLSLEVAELDVRAFEFYLKLGFQSIGTGKSGYIKMSLPLKNT